MQNIQDINNSPYKFYCSIAGGGQSFIGDFCSYAGASKSLIGALVPYDRTIFDNFIGCKINSYASPEGARKLAVASFLECLKAEVPKEFAIGIGASSSIATTNERAGKKHKFNVAAHTYKATYSIEAVVNQGSSREEEEEIIKGMIYEMLLTISTQDSNFEDMREDLAKFDYEEGESAVFREAKNPCFSGMFNKEIVYFSSLYPPPEIAIFPGSFNPLHEGHKQIKSLAEKILDRKVYLEFSMKNTDKGALDFFEVQRRIEGLLGHFHIIDTAATFVEKAEAYKSYNPIFIVGADTWNRIWDEKYGYTVEYLEKFFDENNIKFLVFGRGQNILDRHQPFRILSDEAENFHMPISSTQIRQTK